MDPESTPGDAPRASPAEYWKPALDYLDKEMTATGVLAGFCVAVVAFVLKELNATGGALGSLPQVARWPIATGILAMLLASGCFFGQRTNLASLYGVISFSLVPGDKNYGKTAIILKANNDWRAWHPYAWGRYLLGLALTEFAMAGLYFLPGFSANAFLAVLLLPMIGAIVIGARKARQRSRKKHGQLRHADYFDPVDK
jgi:hypothetical protein